VPAGAVEKEALATPQLPRTGVPVGALSALGLGLLAVGGVTLLSVAGRPEATVSSYQL
jgi:hypothetical protein